MAQGLILGFFAAALTPLFYTGEAASGTPDNISSLYFNDVIWDDDGDSGARQYMRATGQLAPGNYWPNNGKDIPYAFQQLDPDQRQAVEKALRLIEWRTNFCITFKSRQQEREYVLFQPGRGCEAEIGRVYAHVTKVQLHADCFTPGVIQHEVMHVLGMFHEHSRPDRDEYVTLFPENIRSGVDARNFDKLPLMATYGVPYDFDSIMHYGGMDLARGGGRPAIVRKRNSYAIGQRGGLSTFDVARLQIAYNCSLDNARFEKRISERRLDLNYGASAPAKQLPYSVNDLPLV
ncbi:astacin-like metalloendopeptidase [Paramacrobiotus metropolitanus]|uniref:astacin-like metalloendopeptidase n=1 Tax=Paramacrobiotus metropolitanus TaxID=2943436 RepID=UPI002445AAE3|nr:astacin-like metalloendopeptidase [Paramacrobiotus metropolitanus]